jgi:hypothetical protein
MFLKKYIYTAGSLSTFKHDLHFLITDLYFAAHSCGA